MITSKIENLTVDDLQYLEFILNKTMLEENVDCARIQKIISVVQSQKNLLTIPKW